MLQITYTLLAGSVFTASTNLDIMVRDKSLYFIGTLSRAVSCILQQGCRKIYSSRRLLDDLLQLAIDRGLFPNDGGRISLR